MQIDICDCGWRSEKLVRFRLLLGLFYHRDSGLCAGESARNVTQQGYLLRGLRQIVCN